MKHTYAVLSAGDVLYFTRRNGPRAAVGVRNLYVSMSRRDSVTPLLRERSCFTLKYFWRYLPGNHGTEHIKKFKCTDKIKCRLYCSISL